MTVVTVVTSKCRSRAARSGITFRVFCALQVPLTSNQKKHYHDIFQINDNSNSGFLKVEELCRFIDSVGHGVTVNELHEMISEVGIYEHDNGTITESEFFEFIRRTIVAGGRARRTGSHSLNEPTVAASVAASAGVTDPPPARRAADLPSSKVLHDCYMTVT